MERINAFILLMEFLEINQIDYSVLGNSNEYGTIIESDIDIVICKKDFDQITKIILKFCTVNKFILVQIKKHESTACAYVLHLDNNVYFQIDFCHDFLINGRLYFTADSLLQNKHYAVKTFTFFTLTFHYEFVYYLVKRIDKRNIEPQQFAHLQECWKKAGNQILLLLVTYFSNYSIQIIKATFDENNLKFLQDNILQLRIDLFANHKIMLRHKILDLVRLMQKLLKPPGIIIAILGCDGAGKTTLVKELKKQFQFCFNNKTSYHLYPGIIFKQKIVPSFNNPHVLKKRGKVLSFLKLLLFIPEYFIGFWVKLFPRLVGAELIIFDRYFIDIQADPLRYRNGLGLKTTGVINKFIPQPNLWILLDLSPESLLNRKAEIGPDMAFKLRANYLKVAATLPNCLIINAENTINKTVDDASNFIIKHMQQRITNNQSDKMIQR